MTNKPKKFILDFGDAKFSRDLQSYEEEMKLAQKQCLEGNSAAGLTLGFAEVAAETEDQRRFAEACIGALHIFAAADGDEEMRIKLTRMQED